MVKSTAILSSEWKSGKFGRLPLQDSDVTTEVKNGWKRVNTLAHYNVAEGAVISVLTKKPAYDTNVMREVNGKERGSDGNEFKGSVSRGWGRGSGGSGSQ